MKLFELDDQNNVKINSAWIKLIPEFNALFDKRTANPKMKWEKDTMGIKRLTYVYFMLDYGSPLMNWEDDKKHTESLKYCGLDKADIESPVVLVALAKYEELQYEMCRPLKSLRAMYKGLDAMDTYLNDVDFSKQDKMGKLLYTPNQFVSNIAIINKAYEELNKLEKKVEETITQTSSIRGKATMGDREMKYAKPNTTSDTWNEGASSVTIKDSGSFADLAKLLGKDTTKEEDENLLQELEEQPDPDDMMEL